jgi:peptide/nickel transport system substrate-binding protein
MTTLGVAIAACAQPTAIPPTAKPVEPTKPAAAAPTAVPPTAKPAEPTKPPAAKYSEAPMLADLVKAGKLPPIDQRLPQEPWVLGTGALVPDTDLKPEIGKYGGTMRFCTATPTLTAEMWDACCEQPLNTPGKYQASSFGGVMPALFKGWEVAADKKSLTFFMRKGLKWSDGQPCTTADVKFWYEDVLLNKEITPTITTMYKSKNLASGEVMKLDVIDDYAFKVTFAEPGLALFGQLSWVYSNYHSIMRPAHYMKQFHKKYAEPTAFKKLLDDNKLPEAEWFKLFTQRDESTLTWYNHRAVDPKMPLLSPWILETVGTGVVTWVRNPYYWKVDAAGNQLPYIDRFRSEVVSDNQSVLLKTLAGEVDWSRQYASMVNYPLYKENEKKGGFQVNILAMHVAPLQVSFNFTYPDPNWRKVVRDLRFRKAMNMAINHQKVVDTVYQGFGKPPEWFGIKYDKAGAIKLLEEMGLDKKDSEGWRLGPDGKRFVFPLEASKGYTPEMDALCELLVSYWQEVGIKTNYTTVETTLYSTRNTNNDLFVSFRWAQTPSWRETPRSSTGDYLQAIARLWYNWYISAGKEGEEPEPWAKRLWELADRADSFLLSDADAAKDTAEMKQILKDNVPMILPMDDAVYPLLGSSRLGNVPSKGWAVVASFSMEQFFFKS